MSAIVLIGPDPPYRVPYRIACHMQAAPGDVSDCLAIKEERKCNGACMVFIITREASEETTSLVEADLVSKSSRIRSVISQASHQEAADTAPAAIILSVSPRKTWWLACVDLHRQVVILNSTQNLVSCQPTSFVLQALGVSEQRVTFSALGADSSTGKKYWRVQFLFLVDRSLPSDNPDADLGQDPQRTLACTATPTCPIF